LRYIFSGLRIAQVVAQEGLQVRGVLALETPKGFRVPPPKPLPKLPFDCCHGYYLLFAPPAQKVHREWAGLLYYH